MGGEALGDDYRAGPVWHIGIDDEPPTGGRPWFDAPALDTAWWQTDAPRIVLKCHDDGQSKFGSLTQRSSQDIRSRTATTYGWRPIKAGQIERFLSVFVPYGGSDNAESIANSIRTAIPADSKFVVNIDKARIAIGSEGWSVAR